MGNRTAGGNISRRVPDLAPANCNRKPLSHGIGKPNTHWRFPHANALPLTHGVPHADSLSLAHSNPHGHADGHGDTGCVRQRCHGVSLYG